MIREHKKEPSVRAARNHLLFAKKIGVFYSIFNKYKKAGYFPCAVNRMVLWDRKSLNNVVRFEPKSCVYK